MKHFSTHNHSTGSDGKLTPEQVINKAINLGKSYLYFTDHYKVPEELKFNYFKGFFSEEYIQTVLRLKEKYKGKITVYLGGEFDYLEGYLPWTKAEIALHDYDYVLGSVHKIKFKDKYFEIEENKETWIKNAEECGGVKQYVKLYYHQIGLLIKSGAYDTVAHLDYIKVYNEKQDIFSEKDAWYQKEVLDVLKLLKKHKMALELNHGGIRKCKDTFPSLWILKEAKKLGIPITLGLDAHYEAHYSEKAMEELVNIAKKAGYKKIAKFDKRKMIEEELE